MMRPQPLDFMPGNAMRMTWKAELRLIASIASHLSGGNSSTGATCWMPALLTTMSAPPNNRTVSVTIDWISAGRGISALE